MREGFGATLGDEAFELVLLDRPDPWNEWESGAPAPGLLAAARSRRRRMNVVTTRPTRARPPEQAAIEAADAVLESSKPELGAGDRDSEQPAADDDPPTPTHAKRGPRISIPRRRSRSNRRSMIPW